MNTTKKFVIAAVASALMGTTAIAADLGGSCCSDLEERIAELEATTVRKGNRKVSLQISGFVSHQVMFWDDGTQSDMYIGDGANLGSRWRFRGEAKISPELTAGFLYEFGVNNNSVSAANQLNGGDDLGGSTAPELRDSTVFLKHARLGMLKIGHGSTATDNLILIDLGGRAGAGTSDVALYNGGFILRGNGGLLGSSTSLNWAAAIRGHESFDTTRRNHILYETPSLAGFTVQAAVAEDNYWDVALRYAGEFNGVRIAFGIGYQEDTEFNSGSQVGAGTSGTLCANSTASTADPAVPPVAASTVTTFGKCDVKTSDLKGSASILHVPTGLFLTGAAGKRELEGLQTPGMAASAYAGPDLTWWHLTGGVARNFFGIGNTVLFAEYTQSEGGLEQAAFLTNTTNGAAGTGATTNSIGYSSNTLATGRSTSEVTQWGLGINQYVDAAAMEVFATYKNYSLDATGFTGSSLGAAGNTPLNKGVGGVSDFSVFMLGTRINF